MYRLTVVAGPNRGSSYALRDGETSLGRLSQNAIVLNSSKVSKLHCILTVSNGEVICKDQGSSNGTFVNGVLTRTPRQVGSGDRISVGDFVFELSRVSQDLQRDPLALPNGIGAMGGQVIPFPGSSKILSPVNSIDTPLSTAVSDLSHLPNQMPQDLKLRWLWIFEHRLMPYVYQLLLKYEWRTLVFGSYVLFALIAIVFAVAPLIRSNEIMVIRELERRARFMAKQIVETNSPYISQRAETKTEIPESILKGVGVRQALLTDLESRILAPSVRMNEYLNTGPASIAVLKAKKIFLESKKLNTFVVPIGSHTVVAVEPMVLYDPNEKVYLPVAMGVVALDSTVATLGLGDTLVILAEALIWLLLFGGILGLLLYRITLKPLELMNNEIENSVKGAPFDKFARACKFQELGQLQDVLESVLRRLAAVSSENVSGASKKLSALNLEEELLTPFRVLGESSSHGMVVCDHERRVLYLNSVFEELSGIRSDNAWMQPLAEQARDQAFSSLLNDIFERASASNDRISEAFEFSGVGYVVTGAMIGPLGGPPRGFVFTTVRGSDE